MEQQLAWLVGKGEEKEREEGWAPWWQEHDVFVKTLGMLELDMLTLSLSLKRACVEMQRLILADVFIFSSVLCLTRRQTESITLPATFVGVFLPWCATLWSPLCVCVFVLEKAIARRERRKRAEAVCEKMPCRCVQKCSHLCQPRDFFCLCWEEHNFML